jgi:hypothetical protein
MKKIRKISPRQVYWWITVGLTLAKILGDFRRHGRHEEHGQQCTCLGQCLPCIFRS